MGWNRARSIYRSVWTGALLTVALVAGQTPEAQSQVFVTATNGTIAAHVGVSGQISGVAANLAGRIGVDDLLLLGPLMNQQISTTQQSYLTVRIDGGAPVPGSDADSQTSVGWDLIWGDEGSNALDASSAAAKDDQGAWLQEPTANGNVITAKWTTLPGGNDDFPIPPIEVHLKLVLIGDMASFQFTVINKDTRAHTVGLRFAQDFSKLVSAPDGPVYVSTAGPVNVETELYGSSIPQRWTAYNTSGGATVGGLLFGGAGSATTRPDRLTFGLTENAGYPIWTFTPDPTANFGTTPGDASAGVYFQERRYIPGESQTITTFFGRNHSSIDFELPFPAGVDSPFSVKYDPAQPVGQQFTPNPMTVSAFVQNPRSFGLTNVSASVSLPPGLDLAAGETAAKSIGDLAANAEGKTTWSVVPNGKATGMQTIAVSFTAGPGSQGKVVTRSIELPALPSKNLPGGIQMVSFPFTFDDATPAVALGVSQIDFDLLRWNVQLNTYEPVTRILPSEGYWLRLASGRSLDLQSARPITVGSSPFELELRKGWQQIGSPFLYKVRWAEIQVINTDVSDPSALQPLTILEAAEKGWILPTIFGYNPVSGEYSYDVDLSTELSPYEGYWVRAFRSSISLLIPPTSGRSAKPVSRSTGVSAAGGWKLRLYAHGDRSSDTFNFIGLSKGAVDGVDRYDIEKPPAPQGKVTLGIQRTNWGGRSGVYTTDVQALGGRKQWDVLVTSPTPNESVNLSWPDVNRLPKGYELYISDRASGERKLMRQTGAWRVNTGASASRSFTIFAEPKTSGSGALMLTATAKANRSGSGAVAQVNVGANTDATITVRVLGASGQLVRQIVGGRAASAGKDLSFIWDGKDLRGVSVPSGIYTIDVRGVTPDGQTTRRPVPFTIVR